MGPGAAIKNPNRPTSPEFGFHESIPNYSGGLAFWLAIIANRRAILI